MAKVITVEADSVGAVLSDMVRTIAFMTGWNLISMFEAKEITAKAEEGWNRFIQITSKGADATVNTRMSLKLTPPRGKDSAVTLQTVLNGRVRQFMWSIVDGNKGDLIRDRTRGIRLMMTTSDVFRLLKKNIAVLFSRKGNESVTRRTTLKTFDSLGGNADSQKISKDVKSSNFFVRNIEEGRARTRRKNVKRMIMSTFKG